MNKKYFVTFKEGEKSLNWEREEDNCFLPSGVKQEDVKEISEELYVQCEYLILENDEVVLNKEKVNKKRQNEIYSRLSEIDIESLRSLRAIANGTEVDYDTEKIKTLETEAYELRLELSEL